MDVKAERRRTLAAVAEWLRCPACTGALALSERSLACPSGHSFDVARQGYVTLTTGRPGPGTGDSAAMVAAREEFLAAGHYDPVAAALAETAAAGAHGSPGAPLVLDLAGGTGYYLARVLDALPGQPGLCADLSAPALRRAARAHPRAAAIGADAWQPLPLADGCAGIVLSVFGPRNAAEITRVLAPGGTLIIAAPGPGHLEELRGPLGLIGIDPHKSRRLSDAFAAYEPCGGTAVRFRLSLEPDAVATLGGMGPSARHITPQALAARIGSLPSPVSVTAEVEIRALRRP